MHKTLPKLQRETHARLEAAGVRCELCTSEDLVPTSPENVVRILRRESSFPLRSALVGAEPTIAKSYPVSLDVINDIQRPSDETKPMANQVAEEGEPAQSAQGQKAQS